VVDISNMAFWNFTFIRNRILGMVNMSKRPLKCSSVTGCLILRPILEHVFNSTATLSSGPSSDSTHQPVYSLVKVAVVTDAYFYHLLWHKYYPSLAQCIYVLSMTVAIISHYFSIWH
jgi:hypothetical protein